MSGAPRVCVGCPKFNVRRGKSNRVPSRVDEHNAWKAARKEKTKRPNEEMAEKEGEGFACGRGKEGRVREQAPGFRKARQSVDNRRAAPGEEECLSSDVGAGTFRMHGALRSTFQTLGD